MIQWYELMNQPKKESEWRYCGGFDAIYWQSKNGNDMIRLTYMTPLPEPNTHILLTPIHEWVNPQSSRKYPLGRKFRERAKFFGMADELSIEQALKMFHRARKPDFIRIKPGENPKYPEVVGLAYDDQPDKSNDQYDF